jgi:hypothetical protein
MSQCHWCLPAQPNRENHLNFIELCIPIPPHDLSGLVCPVRHLLKFKIEFYQFLFTSLKQRYHLSHQKRSATPNQTTLNTSQFWRQQRMAPTSRFHLTTNMYVFLSWTGPIVFSIIKQWFSSPGSIIVLTPQLNKHNDILLIHCNNSSVVGPHHVILILPKGASTEVLQVQPPIHG